jgi:hypothetical protein
MRAYLADRTGRNNSYRLFSISVMFCSRDLNLGGETSIVMLARLAGR